MIILDFAGTPEKKWSLIKNIFSNFDIRQNFCSLLVTNEVDKIEHFALFFCALCHQNLDQLNSA